MTAAALSAPLSTARADALVVLARHAKSFAFAGRLLPRSVRDDAAVVYAWCRRADDEVDERGGGLDVLAALARELDGAPAVEAFLEVAHRRGIPLEYPRELLAGMEMDVRGVRYESVDDLLLYAWRVAGTVGLMMAHVMGVRDEAALRHAAHLGIAMQLTNVCRDVDEDWRRGRLYLPAALFAQHGVAIPLDPAPAPSPSASPAPSPSTPFPPEARAAAIAAVRELLALADRFYASGDAGLPMLPGRCALAIRAASRIYRAIGTRLARRGHDPFQGRASVPLSGKLGHAAVALLRSPPALVRPFRPIAPGRVLRFPDDILPL